MNIRVPKIQLLINFSGLSVHDNENIIFSQFSESFPRFEIQFRIPIVIVNLIGYLMTFLLLISNPQFLLFVRTNV